MAGDGFWRFGIPHETSDIYPPYDGDMRMSDPIWQEAVEAEDDGRTLRDALNNEREIIAIEARRYASHYPPHSDGANTFVLLAEWIESRMLPKDRGRLVPKHGSGP